MADMKAAVIITAGGLGKRFVGEGAELLPKQFIPLSTKPLIVYSIQSFERSKFISEIVLVVPDKWVEYTQAEIVDKFNIKKVSKVIAGGAERQESVRNGLNSLSTKPEIVAVHDGVRPFVTLDIIDEVITEAVNSGGAIAAIPVTDTIKQSSPEHIIENTVPRNKIWFAQTPQAFKYEILKEAFEKASEDGYLGTDEAELVERLGREVKLVLGSKNNIKITTPEDIKLAELILASGIDNH
ncbi:MAG: 2-C-methyl-D-erythritol 4-phosphate cytidylyltransferase [Thermodesulfobacteriales bacterium]|nr:MAG: 2-C-methyl-D-erythritol 4-phosphate cytidylyltransferase [Thermodesulfobacteriales bacterium]